MKYETQQLLDKAYRALGAAKTLLDHGDADFAAGRAYYSMFYVAEALLHEKDLRSRKHSGVIALFGETFAKTGAMDAKFHRWLLDAFDKRILADYGVEAVLTREDGAQMIVQAREFLESARRLLE
ncbi:MAG: HEPN domain-containing protein [Gammaproteobacteria bacterium]|nr:HEPN domain-containing protein [Gammaproteobacteria bacterium]